MKTWSTVPSFQTYLSTSNYLKMEHELRDLNVIREVEDMGEAHESRMLLNPSGGESPGTRNNSIASESYNASISSRRSFDHHSEDDYQYPTKHRDRSLRIFIRPIIACLWQFIVLVMLIVFIISTESTTYRVVPRDLATLFVEYPQGTTTATTLVGSLLSLISTNAFSEAIRFATVVSLASPGSKNMSLYSLYARISVGSGKTLFDFGRGSVHWTIMSLISLFLFTIQTTAWTTTFTPRTTDIPYQTSFPELNYTDLLVGSCVGAGESDWKGEWDSGYIAATEGTNEAPYLTVNVINGTNMADISSYVLNGTSRGILPIAPTFDNWTRIEAMQQGFTAEVNCAATSDSDPHIRINQTNVADGIFEVALCCNCTSVNYRSSLVYGFGGYLASTTCPMSIEDNVITVYLTSNEVTNKTCTIRPRWLNVNVTYVRGGLVTLEPTQTLPDVPLTSLEFIIRAISALDSHFAYSQTIMGNHVSDTLWNIVMDLESPDASVSQFNKLLEEKTADYIRGVYEYILTMARSVAFCPNHSYPPPQLLPSTTYVNAVVWGQVPRFRLIVAISPLVIMIATVVIILTSLNNARHLDLDHIASFNAMDTLHIIAACSSGNVNTVTFPDYGKNIGLFSKDVEVELTEVEVGSGAAGFRLSSR